ncbi:MAG: GxxExxY protein [Planctomycetota bacterium]|nr:GxxExxY protein [Planctomycetota bacterium]
MLLHKDLTDRVLASAIEVHNALGPGLLESAYGECLCVEFSERGIAFEREVPLPVAYKGRKLNCGYRMDFVVEKSVVLELKSVEEVSVIHEAQLLTYLRLSGLRVGLLINFNVGKLKDGLRRRVV